MSSRRSSGAGRDAPRWLPAKLTRRLFGPAPAHAGRVVTLHGPPPAATAAAFATVGRALRYGTAISGGGSPDVLPTIQPSPPGSPMATIAGSAAPAPPPLTGTIKRSSHGGTESVPRSMPRGRRASLAAAQIAFATPTAAGAGPLMHSSAGLASGAASAAAHLGYQTASFIDNRITTARYNVGTFLPKQLFVQFSKLANVYFLFIAGLQQVPGWSPTGQYTTLLPLVLFVGLAMVREAYDDWLRHKRDETENNDVCEVLQVGADTASVPPYWKMTMWKDVHVGDVVRIKKDKPVPADLILLRTALDQGMCYIQTSQLDGESNLKQRQAIPQINNQLESLEDIAAFKAIVEAETPNEDLYNFDGSITLSDCTRIPLTITNLLLRGTTLRNTPEVVGMVIFSGEETKIRRNANRNKRSKAPTLEKLTNRVVVIIFVCVLALSVISTVLGRQWDEEFRWFLPVDAATTRSGNAGTTWLSTFFTFVILYNTMIPISLYVTLEIVKLAQAMFINQDLAMYHEASDQPAEARTASLNEELGQVSYLFSDKTGTLTENQMLFRQMSVAGLEFFHPADEGNDGGGAAGTNLDSSMVTESLANLIEGNDDESKSVLGSVAAGLHLRPRTTRHLAEYLADHSTHPLVQRIAFFIQAVALCHTAIPDSDPTLSQRTSSSTMDVSGAALPIPGTGSALSAMDHAQLGGSKTLDDATNGTGDRVDTTPASERLHGHIVYQSASPDEVALVNSAREFGFALVHRNANGMTIARNHCPPDMPTCPMAARFHTLDSIEFSSTRKRMSIILRFPDGQIVMLSKGADSAMLERSKPLAEYSSEEQVIHRATLVHLDRFASKGLRTLVYAVRHLNEAEYHKWSRIYLEASTSVTDRANKLAAAADMIERNWTIIGATGIEDRLQRGVPEAIHMLERASIKVWMVTGDKKETAISIGHACGLVKESSEVLCLEAQHADGSDMGDDALIAQVDGLHERLRAWNAARMQGEQRNSPLRRRTVSGRSTSHVPTASEHATPIASSTLQLPGFEAGRSARARAPEGGGSNGFRGSTGNLVRWIQSFLMTGSGGKMAPASAYAMCPVPEIASGPNPFVMVVDGPTIARFYAMGGEPFAQFMALACTSTSVVCTRVSPLQKSLVVRSVREYMPNVVTAAVGDGANDIAMIQQAHVGIGITGREGMQAARSSDYSIARFRFVQRLLLVHGHWSYIRVAKFTLGTFYKCIMFYMTQFLFQVWSGWSGTSLYESWTLTMYNIIFSSLPVILLGILDRDLPEHILNEFPELYRVGQRNGEFDTKIFLIWLVKSMMQAIVVIAGTFFLQTTYPSRGLIAAGADVAPWDSLGNLYVTGTIAYTSVVLTATIQICYISPSTITLPLHICAALTVGVWFLWQAVYSTVWPRVGINTGYEQAGLWGQIVKDTSDPSGSGGSGGAALWWATVILITVLGVAPEWAFYKLRRYYRPTDAEKLMEMDVVRTRYEAERRKLAHLVEDAAGDAPAVAGTAMLQQHTAAMRALRGDDSTSTAALGVNSNGGNVGSPGSASVSIPGIAGKGTTTPTAAPPARNAQSVLSGSTARITTGSAQLPPADANLLAVQELGMPLSLLVSAPSISTTSDQSSGPAQGMPSSSAVHSENSIAGPPRQQPHAVHQSFKEPPSIQMRAAVSDEGRPPPRG
ncbi:phospholipid-translocating P-type ATPase, flippase [Allomyces macrogynus ATCC 38327]|uniref:Phospholipid-transporting ATPase n=1 Tax=Allomyces macrogynus (strain ATCC 38327) TaxID=578462 RepID=A0A0L0SLE4_ALLM3|nr:phospholipid-translocating P-type ATPase, flippase, variant [Allomyces macrogynus ATCC 38327]KNE63376.1 phospholipid-translocating P-type ATPase, flippase [Allomyces macrogynus ATCC 38327]|eukprot:KNE63375.1 phospholipid-translocating P-type ATPase, flippase, variant [Allomyces macrogynus ATCC 38327]